MYHRCDLRDTTDNDDEDADDIGDDDEDAPTVRLRMMRTRKAMLMPRVRMRMTSTRDIGYQLRVLIVCTSSFVRKIISLALPRWTLLRAHTEREDKKAKQPAGFEPMTS